MVSIRCDAKTPNSLFGGSENHAPSALPFPRTTLGHRAGYPQNHCGAKLLGKGQPSIGVVCGSDNHMLGKIQNSDRMARLAMSPIESEDRRHSQSDPSNSL